MITSNWGVILRAITAPVILFGLVLLVLGSVSITAMMSEMENSKIGFIMIGTGFLTLLVIFLVFFLTWFKPENLIYSEAGHLAEKKMMYGTQRKRIEKSAVDKSQGQPKPITGKEPIDKKDMKR